MQLLKLRTYLILFAIIFLAVFLRFWNIGINPPGIHSDEADTGYSAYSILKTGITQYGSFNPLALEEFNGGTHPPLYTYTLIPLVKFLGLNITVERTPSVIFGILTIPIFFFLLRRLFQSDTIALTGSFLLSVNPWAIHMSRQGLLESMAIFLVLLGVLLFLLGNTRKYFYIASAIIFGLSLHEYDAPKVFVPLLLILLTWYRWDLVKKAKKYIVISIFILLIFYSAMLKVLFIDGEISDYNKVSLQNSLSLSTSVKQERQFSSAPLFLSSLFHNKATIFIKRFETNYFNIFSLNWFFVNGDSNLQRAVANHGQFHLFELPLFFLGFYQLFKYKKKLGFLILGWLLLGAVPGALTEGNYTYRSVLLLPAPIIFSTFGLVWFWNFLEKKFKSYARDILKITTVVLIAVYVSSFVFTYFFDYPVYASEWWFKQRNESLVYAVSVENNYKRIFVVGGIEWPLLYAFDEKVDPRLFQHAYKNKDKYKGVDTMNLGKFSFGEFEVKKEDSLLSYFPKHSLVIIDASYSAGNNYKKAFSGTDPLNIIYKVVEIN